MKSQQTTKYYVYLRKSSEGEDRQVQSIERQRDEVQKLIDNSQAEIVEFFEESRSAMTPNNRPEFSRMIKGIKQGKANGIICWHINRLARNPLESGIVQQYLEDGTIHNIITKERVYRASDNAIIYSVESSLATQYSKDLGKMVKSGIEKKISQGIAPLKAPIGYSNSKRPEHGSNYILKDDELFPLVRKLWDLMLTGQYTVPRILEYISNDVGLRKKICFKNQNNHIARSSLYRMFTNPFYSGHFLYNGILYKGIHEAMISLDEYDMVQRLLGKDGKPRYISHQFNFTGVLKCGNCGCAITATEKSKYIKATGLYTSYIYYYCSKRKKEAKFCPEKPMTESELEKLITNELENLSITSEYKDYAMVVLKKNMQSLIEQEEKIALYKLQEIKNLEKEIKNLLSLRLNETINNDEFVEAKQERENALQKLKSQFEVGGFESISLLNKLDDNLSFVTDLNNKFENETKEGKKSILLGLGWNHVLKDKKLIIDKPIWLNVLANNKDTILSEIEWLELDKSIESYNFLCDFWDKCPYLRALVDAVGTESQHSLPKQELKPLKNKLIYDDG